MFCTTKNPNCLETLSELLPHLPVEYRQVIEHRLLGKGYKAIGTALGITANLACVRYFRAVVLLREANGRRLALPSLPRLNPRGTASNGVQKGVKNTPKWSQNLPFWSQKDPNRHLLDEWVPNHGHATGRVEVGESSLHCWWGCWWASRNRT